jgi:hypothetical protein
LSLLSVWFCSDSDSKNSNALVSVSVWVTPMTPLADTHDTTSGHP